MSTTFSFKWLLFCGAFILSINLIPRSECHGEILIICNPSVHTDRLSREGIKDIFTGKVLTWPDNTDIEPITLKTGPVHVEFVKNFTDKSEAQFLRYWRNMTFTGKGIAPKSMNTEQEVVKFVTETPGAIGYISSSTAPEKTKIVEITDN